MKRIRIQARARREPSWRAELPLDPRDPDVVRAKALARAHVARARRWIRADGVRPGVTRDLAGSTHTRGHAGAR
jgi:hypothetical protein